MIDELVETIATSIRFISNGEPQKPKQKVNTRGAYAGPADITSGPHRLKLDYWWCRKPNIKIPMKDGFLDTNLDDITGQPVIVESSCAWTVLYPYKDHIITEIKHFEMNIYKKQGELDMEKTLLELQTKLAGYCDRGRKHKDFFKAPNGDIIPNEVGIEMNFSDVDDWDGTCDVCCANAIKFPHRFKPFLILPDNTWVCKECIGLYRLRMFGLSERALRRKQLLPMGFKF